MKRLTLDHPPLGHLLTGVFLKVLSPAYSHAGYFADGVGEKAFEFGYSFFRKNEYQLQALLLVARLPFLFVSIVGAFYCYLLSRSLFGRGAALFSLVLCAFCPLLLGWSRYVYLDGLLATTLLATLAHLVWYLRKGEKRQLVALVVSSALTLTAKYSGLLILLPVVLSFFVPLSWFSEREEKRSTRLFSLLSWGIATALLVWGIFGFPRDVGFYFDGYRRIYSVVNAGYQAHLFGKFSDEIWYFYPVLLLTKATLPALCAFFGVFVLLFRWLRSAGKRRDGFVLLLLVGTSLAFLGLTTLKALPIGARYLLPMFPPLYVAAGALVAEGGLLKGRSKAIAFVLAAFHGSATFRSFPDEMAYFNEAFGGPARGIFISNDASLDAGQNLPRLARYLAKRGNPRVKLLYQGTDLPSRWGIVSQPIPQSEWDAGPLAGIYVVSSYPLVYGQREHNKRPAHRDWLRTLTPKVVIGHSLFVYEVPEAAKPRSAGP